MNLKSGSILLMLLLLFIESCKLDQDLYAPTVFNFTVVDEYTNQPLSGCSIIVYYFGFGGHIETSLIGNTDANGQFQYTFDQQPTDENGYSLGFSKPGYYDGGFNLRLTNQTSDELINMNKETTLGIKIRRLTPPTGCPPENYYLYYNVHNINSWGDSYYFQTDTVSTTNYHYRFQNVRSNTTYEITWGTHFWSSCTGNINSSQNFSNVLTGYNDTTYCSIDY